MHSQIPELSLVVSRSPTHSFFVFLDVPRSMGHSIWSASFYQSRTGEPLLLASLSDCLIVTTVGKISAREAPESLKTLRYAMQTFNPCLNMPPNSSKNVIKYGISLLNLVPAPCD